MSEFAQFDKRGIGKQKWTESWELSFWWVKVYEKERR